MHKFGKDGDDIIRDLMSISDKGVRVIGKPAPTLRDHRETLARVDAELAIAEECQKVQLQLATLDRDRKKN